MKQLVYLKQLAKWSDWQQIELRKPETNMMHSNVVHNVYYLVLLPMLMCNLLVSYMVFFASKTTHFLVAISTWY